MDSILLTIRKGIGPNETYEHFDQEFIMFINSALSRLTQLGVGPREGFGIKDDKEKWSDFIGDSKILDDVKEYVYLRVKVVFDPPSSAAVLSSFNEKIKDLEWLLNNKVD